MNESANAAVGMTAQKRPLRVVIIGGGITGCAAAVELAREGHGVTLLEKSHIAAMASGWTLGGVRQSGRDPVELPLARAAVAMWSRLSEVLGTDVEYRRGGNLRFARSAAEVDVICAVVESQLTQGLDLEFLPDNAAVRAIASAVADSVVAASFCPTDGHANPVKATRGFAQLARSLGADIREGVAVRAITTAHGRISGVESSAGFIAADRVIIAAGINTPALLEPLGLRLPLSIKAVHVVQTEPLPPIFAPVFGVANADCAGRQEVDGRLRFTSGAEDWDGDPAAWTEHGLAPSPADVRRVVARVAEVLPVAGTTPVARAWGGLIDLTPDALPVIDAPDSVDGLVVAAGFSGHGFCLGPVSGQLCADLALGEIPRHSILAFRLSRFDASGIGTSELTLHG